MERIVLSTGLKSYEIEDEQGNTLGVLQFNPSDQNLYARFVELFEELPTLVKRYEDATEAVRIVQKEQETRETENEPAPPALDSTTMEHVAAIKTMDADIKSRLGYVFGTNNDFNRLFGEINVLAMTDTGSTLIENLLEALLPVIETNGETRKKMMLEKAKKQRKQAATNRAQRRGQ